MRLSNDVSVSECSCVMNTDPGKCLDLPKKAVDLRMVKTELAVPFTRQQV